MVGVTAELVGRGVGNSVCVADIVVVAGRLVVVVVAGLLVVVVVGDAELGRTVEVVWVPVLPALPPEDVLLLVELGSVDALEVVGRGRVVVVVGMTQAPPTGLG